MLNAYSEVHEKILELRMNLLVDECVDEWEAKEFRRMELENK